MAEPEIGFFEQGVRTCLFLRLAQLAFQKPAPVSPEKESYNIMLRQRSLSAADEYELHKKYRGPYYDDMASEASIRLKGLIQSIDNIGKEVYGEEA